MSTVNPTNKLAQAFCSVNPPLNTQLPLFPGSMIHHKAYRYSNHMIVSHKSISEGKPYGVSRYYRVLSPQLLLKKFDRISDCLEVVLGLTLCQREATLQLLRLWAYYGKVYPKESQVCAETRCSKATYWRTIRRLEELGLIKVVNRYVLRPHAQISNLYRLDRLILLLARWLAEHGTGFLEKWLQPYLIMPGAQFWRFFAFSPVSGCRSGP